MAELLFKNCRKINADNYKSLGEIQLRQMSLGATMGFGKEYKTPEHFLEQCGDSEIKEGGVEFWDIVDKKNPNEVLYECWYYLGNTANVFLPVQLKIHRQQCARIRLMNILRWK